MILENTFILLVFTVISFAGLTGSMLALLPLDGADKNTTEMMVMI